jgi:hypothetical protein
MATPVTTPSPQRPRWLGWAAGVALLAAFSGLAALGLRRAGALRAGWPAEADLMYLPTSRTLRLLSLGHTELAADLVAARTNVYYGTQLATKAPQRWLDQYIHTAIDLDPRFHRLYMSGAAMVIYYGGRITPDQVMKANAVLERAIAAFPGDWNFLFQLGFNKFFEAPDAAGRDDPRVPQWRREGVEALRQAALFEEAPAWLPNLTARLLTKQGADELAIRHLEQAYAATSSEETRAQIRAQLQLLARRSLGADIEEGRRHFDADLARGYPYAPEAFSVIAGPRRPPGADVPGLTGPAAPPPPSAAPPPPSTAPPPPPPPAP